MTMSELLRRIKFLEFCLSQYDCAWGSKELDPEHTCTDLGGPPCLVLQRDRATGTKYRAVTGEFVPWKEDTTDDS